MAKIIYEFDQRGKRREQRQSDEGGFKRQLSNTLIKWDPRETKGGDSCWGFIVLSTEDRPREGVGG